MVVVVAEASGDSAGRSDDVVDWIPPGSVETSSFGSEEGVMPEAAMPGKAKTRRYSSPEKEAAARMVRQLRAELGTAPRVAH